MSFMPYCEICQKRVDKVEFSENPLSGEGAGNGWKNVVFLVHCHGQVRRVEVSAASLRSAGLPNLRLNAALRFPKPTEEKE